MKIELIAYTPNPLGVIAFAKNMMKPNGKMPGDYTRDELEKEFADCISSALFGPLEFVHFVFRDSDVTRAYTHQKVRTRLASYMQESMRFSTRENGEFGYLTGPTVKTAEQKELYDRVCRDIGGGYAGLIKMGVAPEDARGLLPTNVFTSIASSMSYNTLARTAEQRLCFNTQAEHREAMLQVKKLITEVEPLLGAYLKPSCGHCGYCGWEGSADRSCPLQRKYPFRSEVVKYNKEIKELVESLKGVKNEVG